MTDSFDIVVIGGGLAGLTAGLFGARLGRATLVLEPAIPGGHLVNIEKIEDFPGFPEGVAGFDLGPIVQEQAANAGAEFRMAEAHALEPDGDGWLVTTSDGQARAGAVIVATGSRPRALGVPGEDRLLGKGVSHCASCDGPLMRGQIVGVVGGGDSALQEALTLAELVSQVLVFHRGPAYSAQRAYQQRAAQKSTITAHPNTVVDEILGEDVVTAVAVRNVEGGGRTSVDVAGLFIYVGLEPNSRILRAVVKLDDRGRVPTDAWMRTERPGLFAAGDVRSDSASQAISSAGDGATAAVAAHRFLQERESTQSASSHSGM